MFETGCVQTASISADIRAMNLRLYPQHCGDLSRRKLKTPRLRKLRLIDWTSVPPESVEEENCERLLERLCLPLKGARAFGTQPSSVRRKRRKGKKESATAMLGSKAGE